MWGNTLKKLSVYILSSILFVIPAAANAVDAFAGVEREINHELAQIRGLEKKWSKVEKDYGDAEERYKTASRLVRKCNRGAWSVLFKDIFKDLDKARQKLEEARSAANAANKTAKATLKTQDRNIRILEVSYSGKGRDATYWEKMNTIVNIISTDYANVITDVVVPAYEKYIQGADELSESYSFAAEDCNRLLPLTPLRQVFKETLGIVVGKISIVNTLADEILESVPDKLKSKG